MPCLVEDRKGSCHQDPFLLSCGLPGRLWPVTVTAIKAMLSVGPKGSKDPLSCKLCYVMYALYSQTCVEMVEIKQSQ